MLANMADKITLSNGVKMPGYGYGVYKAFGDDVTRGVACAFDCGYRYVDTASFYKNEREVGKALAESGIARDQLFIVSKIWPTEFNDPEAALERSLNRLGLDYLDGYLLHWPGLDASLRLKTWETLLKAQENGKILSLGVSNFLQIHLEELHKNFNAWPSMNQIEIHPRYQEKNLTGFCQARNIRVVAWAPLGRGASIDIPQIRHLAQKLNRQPAQIILRWHIQNSITPIPKSTHCERIAQNADVFDFELDKHDMAIMDSLDLPDHQGRTGKDPMQWPTNR